MKWVDSEWEEAENANEKPVYWWVYPYKNRDYPRYIRLYKPSLAKVVAKRTGEKLVNMSNGEVLLYERF